MATLADMHGDELAPEHADDLLRLQRIWKAQSGFRLVLIEHNVPVYRDRIIRRLADDGMRAMVLDAATLADVAALEETLARAAEGYEAVHVVGLDQWLAGDTGRQRIEGLNVHRERIARTCPVLLMLWLPLDRARDIALAAPDLWEWRTAVLDFSTTTLARFEPLERTSKDTLANRRRLDEIERALDDQILSPRQRAVLLREASDILREEQPFRALAYLEEALRLHQEHSSERDVIDTQLQIARSKDAQGDIAAAAQLLRDTVLPGIERLGDERMRVRLLRLMANRARNQGQYAEARELYEQAIAAFEDMGAQAEQAATLNNLAGLLRAQGAYAEARPLLERALAIHEKQFGPDHPDTATSLNNLAALLQNQGAYAEARRLIERALAIREKQLGPDHPDTAKSLDNLASLLQKQGAYAEARPLYERALAIREKRLGPDHPDIANSLNNLASLLRAQGAHAEARPLFERALAICEAKLGPDHPDTRGVRQNLQRLPNS